MELFVFDEDYVRRLREGDPVTAAHFFKYFGDLLLMKLRRKLTSVEAIDEVRQEVFTRTIERLGELREARKLGAFVLSVCRNVLLEHYRTESRTDALTDQMDVADGHDMEAVFETSRNQARVKKVMQQMPERDAEILRAIFLDEKDKEELCRRLGIERSYLRVLLHRAKEKFRQLYLRRKSGRLSVFETFGGHSSLSI